MVDNSDGVDSQPDDFRISAGDTRLVLEKGRGIRPSFSRSLWPAWLAAIFGMLLFPFNLKGFARSYVELGDMGLINPGAAASGLGEASALPVSGVLLSIVCFLLMAWSQSNWPREELRQG